jgi:hypothetical protein
MLKKSKMTLSFKIIWIMATILGLVLNSKLPFSVWLIMLNLVPLLLTVYFFIAHSHEFKLNTPWGIPYSIIVYMNTSILEGLFSKAATFYNLLEASVLIIKFSFVFLLFMFIALSIKRRQNIY